MGLLSKEMHAPVYCRRILRSLPIRCSATAMFASSNVDSCLARFRRSTRCVINSDVTGAPFSHLFTELKISLIEVHISAIELEISPIHLKISSNQLEISTIRPI